MEGLRECEANLVIYVHPSRMKNVKGAILRELSSLLFNFNEAFDGVVLSYKFDPPPKHARILSGVHPYFAVKFKASLLLFSPKPNMLLEGRVVKISRESIHVIVLGFASAIITEQEIRDEFRYKSKRGEGLYVSRIHRRHVIRVGTMLRFVAKSLDEEVLHILGSLIPAHTGSITWFNKYSEEVSTNSSKRRAEVNEEPEIQDHISAGRQAYDHKAKKRRVPDD